MYPFGYDLEGLSNVSLCQRHRKRGESITITTYYPAPLGVYRSLQSQRLAVEDTNKDGNFDNNDMPTDDGDLYVANNIYVNLGEHKMMMGFENLGEDDYLHCEEGPYAVSPNGHDTCDGDKILPYRCSPEEERICNDIYSVVKDSCTDEMHSLGEVVTRKVICRAVAVWRKQSE